MIEWQAKGIVLFRLLLRFSLIAVIAYGLYLNIYAGFDHQFQSWLLLFYTTQSNALVLILFAILCAQDLKVLFTAHRFRWSNEQDKDLEKIKSAFTWMISITGIVWHVMLVPELDHFVPEITRNTGLVISAELWLSFALLHTWSPLLAFLDWLFFSVKGRMRALTPFKWLLIPLIYFAFICLWVHLDGPVKPEYNLTYPYPFLDFQANGVLETWKGLIVILSGMLCLGYMYFGLDNLLTRMFSRS